MRLNGGWRTWALLASLLFNAAFVAGFVIRHARHPLHVSGGNRLDAATLHKKLRLSPEQERLMGASRVRMQREMDALAIQLTERKEALTLLLAADPIVPDFVQAELDRMAKIHASLQQAVVGHFIEVRKCLAPCQRKEFDGLLRGRMCPHVCKSQPAQGPDPCAGEGADDADEGGHKPSEK